MCLCVFMFVRVCVFRARLWPSLMSRAWCDLRYLVSGVRFGLDPRVFPGFLTHDVVSCFNRLW